jgi:hypothetical protein
VHSFDKLAHCGLLGGDGMSPTLLVLTLALSLGIGGLVSL